jgi:pyruvate/2-oxoglutarate dehydrogenase complex dihydrolipoamide dehydrogenase (E3) component
MPSAEAPEFGVSAGEAKVDFRKVHDHIHSVIGAIAPNDSVERFRAMGVNVIESEARISRQDNIDGRPDRDPRPPFRDRHRVVGFGAADSGP